MVVDIQLDQFDKAIISKNTNAKKANSYYSAELLFSYMNAGIKIKKDGVTLAYIDKIG